MHSRYLQNILELKLSQCDLMAQNAKISFGVKENALSAVHYHEHNGDGGFGKE